MTTFQDARAFLLEHRTDYDTAVADFRWPDPLPAFAGEVATQRHGRALVPAIHVFLAAML